jgi:hypothetical protein
MKLHECEPLSADLKIKVEPSLLEDLDRARASLEEVQGHSVARSALVRSMLREMVRTVLDDLEGGR